MEEVELKFYNSGVRCYYKKGTFILHREDGPAIEHTNGRKEWYKDGKYHREDGPAVEWPDGSKFWFQYGKYHRLDGPAIEWHDGYKVFWIYGKHIPNVDSIKEALIKSLLE